MTTTHSTVDGKDYVEEPATDGDVASRITGRDACSGGLQGDLTWQGLAVMGESGGGYVSVSRFDGTVDGRSGSFAMRITGSIAADGASDARFVVIGGSGSRELAGLSGSGRITSDAAGGSELTLDYAIGA
ncbi:MAG TPA: DUF3224 domain-containing protein [Mycobacteriales bacterium]|nr:DUF3224 domain-containing protein [Mycobacteriales bacterium]